MGGYRLERMESRDVLLLPLLLLLILSPLFFLLASKFPFPPSFSHLTLDILSSFHLFLNVSPLSGQTNYSVSTVLSQKYYDWDLKVHG